MFEKKSFTYWIISLPIIAILLTSSILTYEFVEYETQAFEKESAKLEEEHISKIKDRIKNRINRVTNLIETNIELIRQEEKNNIKDIIGIGYKTIEETYQNNLHLNKETIIQLIKSRLENLKFYANGSGYFFIINLEDKVLMQPQTPEHTNRVFTNLQDKNGKYFIQSFRNIAQTKGEGFDTWHWSKPNTNAIGKKIGYIKLFKPLDLYIGTAIYEDDIDAKIKKETLKLLDIIKYGKDEYVFAVDKQGTTISHINKKFIGKDIKTLSQIEQDIITNIIKVGSPKDGGFIGYKPTSYNVNEKLSDKISYVKTIPTLQWVIGTGQYVTTLQEQIKKKKEVLKAELKDTSNTIIVISMTITIILILFLTSISRKIQNMLSTYEKEIALKNEHLKELNESLESQVKDQVLKIRQKEDMLNQQSRLAAMGEMIGNIAHQWRQPLSAISTAASGTKMQDEMGILNKKDLHTSLETIVDSTQVLSQTIDDFRNFFKKDKSKKYFYIESTIQKVFSLLNASLKNKDIEIIQDIDNFEIYNLENEFTQALLNIINNAKDALEESSNENKYLFISTKATSENYIITIKDNAGGIDESIINKIYEPYFTTKFKSQGTGIGLYMTRTIILNHMDGLINTRNETFMYNECEYKGAVFEIVLDKKSV